MQSSARAGAEFEHGHALESLSRFQFGRRKARVVGRIRKMLRLQAEGKSPLVDPAFLAGDRSVEKVSGVKLQSRFGRRHSQDPPGSRLVHLGRLGQLSCRMIENEVVVIAMAEAQLRIVRIDPLSYGMRRSKIKWRPFHRL